MSINQNLFNATHLPKLIHQSNTHHGTDIKYLRKASEDRIIVIRDFDIKMQYENGKQRQNIHDGNFLSTNNKNPSKYLVTIVIL